MPIAIEYEGMRFDEAFRADLLINDLVIVELKSIEATRPVHKKALLTYLRLSHRKLCLLISFGAPWINEGITRIPGPPRSTALAPVHPLAGDASCSRDPLYA